MSVPEFNCIGCQGDIIYAIIKDDQAFRFTFSKSVAKHILTIPGVAGKGYEARRFRIIKGRPLGKGEATNSSLYAICSPKGRILRATTKLEVAEYFTEDSNRHICQAFIEPLKGKKGEVK